MSIKKIWLILLVCVLSLGFVACGEEEVEEEPKLTTEQELQKVLNGVIVDASIKKLVSDLELPNMANGEYYISWSIDEKYSEYAKIEEYGEGKQKIVIVRPEIGEAWAEFVLVGEIGEGVTKVKREWTGCYVMPEQPAPIVNTVELFSQTQGAYIQISGQAIYMNGSHGIWIKDKFGTAYIYTEKNGKLDVEVGDTFTVTGTKDLYYSLLEVKDVTLDKESVVKGTFDYNDEVIESDVDTLAGYAPVGSTYSQEQLSVLGKFYKISGKIIDDPNGKYTYAVENPATGKSVVIYDSALADGVKDKVASLKGKYAEMVVLYNDFYSTGFARVVPILDSIKETEAPTLSDEDKVNDTIATLQKLLSEKVVEDIALPTSNDYDGLTIEWASNKPEVLSAEGKFGTSENKEEEVELTAVIKLGEITKEEKFTVTVAFASEMTVAEAVKACDGDSKVVSLKGKVVALDVDGYFYLADSTGVIYVRSKLPEGVVSGDSVVVDGQTSVYLNSNKQYTRQINANNISKIEEEVAVMEAVKTAISDFPSLEAENGVLSNAAIETIKAYSNYGKLVEITGYVKTRGQYCNAYICEANDDTSAGLLVYYKSDKQDELKAYEGKKVTVVICVYDANGFDGWRLGSPLSITEVTE